MNKQLILKNYHTYPALKTSGMLMLLIAFCTSSGIAQDHAVDLTLGLNRLESVETGIKIDMQGIGISYTGYLGIGWTATQLELGRSKLDISTETRYFDPLLGISVDSTVTTETSTTDVTYGTWYYANDELNGFGLGGGIKAQFSSDLIVLNGVLSVGYRFTVVDKFTIMPLLQGSYGLVSYRDAFSGSGFGSFGYGGRLHLGYLF